MSTSLQHCCVWHFNGAIYCNLMWHHKIIIKSRYYDLFHFIPFFICFYFCNVPYEDYGTSVFLCFWTHYSERDDGSWESFSYKHRPRVPARRIFSNLQNIIMENLLFCRMWCSSGELRIQCIFSCTLCCYWAMTFHARHLSALRLQSQTLWESSGFLGLTVATRQTGFNGV